MSTPNHELAELLSSLFGRHVDSDSESAEIDRNLWATLCETGLDRLTGGPDREGGDAGWAESALLLCAVGANAARVPVAENDLLAGWLLDTAGIAAHDSDIRVAALLDSDGRAGAVPWASQTDRLVLLWRNGDDWQVSDLARSEVGVESGRNRAGESRDAVVVDTPRLDGTPVSATVATEYRLRGALTRSHLMVGAMSRIQQIVIEHAGARVQFGRPLAKFQAVQHMVAALAAEAALAAATTAAAADLAGTHGFGDPRTALVVAASRSVTGHAASVVVRNAHQVLGAIGFTREHELHRYTNRLLSWRAEYGSVRSWDDELTRVAVDAGTKGLWPLLASGG
ncbi:acyl-CoA dehydrogenase family protein [Williamsia sp. 1135]|uniref:acyl-CoA dehydrogenase family protein n=1 Tax=Williamsia sp. 1135 TaxID=1889262 RepID=UPI000A106C93|nr:acyl-CoA dehydrogenase family protein [Williamsia sp. 1135]ORM34045.1 acyl-CoA dehydrogenase [Williamsia sp. 1135]